MQKVYLVGIGMGTAQTQTVQAKEIIAQADVLIGAKRMVDSVLEQHEEYAKKQCIYEYRAEQIGAYLRTHTFQTAAILLSGDVGFYSGAKKLSEELKDFQMEYVPGISSLVYFCSRIQTAWDDVTFLSLHGRSRNLIGYICRKKKVAVLLSGDKDLHCICEKLIKFHLTQVKITIAERLSYADERIQSGYAQDFLNCRTDHLLVAFFENPQAKNDVAVHIADSEFVRGKVPMTKQAVRAVTVAQMQLQADSVVYDIGAGTGSVSVQMALQSPDITVYAVERNEEGCQLIESNCEKFCVDNVCCIQGMAPACLNELPAPTHAFIGGSAGNMAEIFASIYKKNVSCRIVVNVVTLESLIELMRVVEQYPDYEADFMQVQAAQAQQLGHFHLMKGENPVYIVTVYRKRM